MAMNQRWVSRHTTSSMSPLASSSPIVSGGPTGTASTTLAAPEQALGLNRLAVQFDTQAFDCRELADKIEQSGLDQVGVPVSRLRYCVDGHEYPDTESNLAGDGQHPPFRVFDIDAQDYLPGVYATRAEAEAALPGSTEQRATVRLTPSCVLRWLRLKP